MLNLIQTSSLEKICPKLTCNAGELNSFSVLSGERFSFQIAYRGSMPADYRVILKSDFTENIVLYDVTNVPVGVATDVKALNDPNYISHEPGIFPDALIPKSDDTIYAAIWYKSIWITVLEGLPPGEHKITLSFVRVYDPNEDIPEEENEKSLTFCLEVIPETLPEQELIFTQWFHADCIAEYYHVPMLSENHWELIEKFIKMAVQHGINMILTPIFTPPIDTAVGFERPTIQLVKIKKDKEVYQFDFSDLDRWVNLAQKYGMKHFEMAHFFTQWGAKCTPKIIAEENGEEKRIFGWDVAAHDPAYDYFLSQFIPALVSRLEKLRVLDATYFHISDEPALKNKEIYGKAKSIAKKYLSGLRVIDALSEYEFYSNGMVENPVVATDSIKPFLENKVENLWAYYCCSESVDVSNRFITMPSYRNRSIGCQLYKYDIKGFLQWGYNFYYSFLSKGLINPFFQTDALGRFPSGDSFSVYPCPEGPQPAIGLVVFYEALQDLRAMKLLESKIGCDKTLEFIESVWGSEICFDECAIRADQVLNLRRAINDELKK